MNNQAKMNFGKLITFCIGVYLRSVFGCHVQLFQDYDYNGRMEEYSGKTILQDFTDVSSLKIVEPGCCVVLYDGWERGSPSGNHQEFCTSNKKLKDEGWNDRALSLETKINEIPWEVLDPSVNCWSGCDSQAGKCEDVCGTGGYCCRRGKEGCTDEQKKVATKNHHTCVTSRVPCRVEFYNDKDYKGKKTVITYQETHLNVRRPITYEDIPWHTSSLKIIGGCCADVYPKAWFKGWKITYCHNTKSVGSGEWEWRYDDDQYDKKLSLEVRKYDCKVEFYEQYNYGGAKETLTYSRLQFYSFDNDMSSMKIYGDCCAVIYKGEYFRRTSKTICEPNTPNIGTSWDNQVSSVKFVRAGLDCKVIFYEHDNYNQHVTNENGRVTVYWHSERNLDRTMTSMKIEGKCCAVLYKENNFGGESLKVCSDIPFIGPGWNDKTASLKVIKADHGGCTLLLKTKTYNDGALFWYFSDQSKLTHEVNTIKIRGDGDCCAVVYEAENFGGNSKQVCKDNKFAGAVLNAKIKSIKIIRTGIVDVTREQCTDGSITYERCLQLSQGSLTDIAKIDDEDFPHGCYHRIGVKFYWNTKNSNTKCSKKRVCKCNKANIKWRDDLRCGPQNKLPNGAAAQCNPSGAKHCCSPAGGGRCGPQDGERWYFACACPGCFDYGWAAYSWKKTGKCQSMSISKEQCQDIAESRGQRLIVIKKENYLKANVYPPGCYYYKEGNKMIYNPYLLSTNECTADRVCMCHELNAFGNSHDFKYIWTNQGQCLHGVITEKECKRLATSRGQGVPHISSEASDPIGCFYKKKLGTIYFNANTASTNNECTDESVCVCMYAPSSGKRDEAFKDAIMTLIKIVEDSMN